MADPSRARVSKASWGGDMEETRCRFGPSDHIRLKEVRRTGATGISTGFVETAVGQVVSKRRPMRWTRRGAHLMLQARTRVLDSGLEDAIRRRWPGFRPPPRSRKGAARLLGLPPGHVAPVLGYALLLGGVAIAQEARVTVVRIAELEIDPARMAHYRAAVREEMEASVRLEPGVIAIYAVAQRDDPNKLWFFEMYTDEAAYNAHREAPHFRRYFETTKDMITARRLIETVPVQLNAKAR